MTSTDQQPQPDSRKYGSIKSKGRNGGVGEADDWSCQEGLLAGWLGGWQQRFMAADTEESISVCQCLWKQREGQQVSEILCFILAVVLPGRETVCVYFCKVAL